MKVKICGITTMADVALINQYRPDFAGFVFAKSKRQISFEKAKSLISALDKGVGAVGVFVDASLGEVADAAKFCGLELIQLHGGEDSAYIEALKNCLPNTPVIKGIRVGDYAAMEEGLSLGADYLLFDSYHKDQQGGTGKQGDWTLIQRFQKAQGHSYPFFLAGGIGPENVREAMALKPWAIDLSSKVEKTGGSGKDPEKMATLFKEIERGNSHGSK